MNFSLLVHFGVGPLDFLLLRLDRQSLGEKTWQNCASIPKVFTAIEVLNDSE